MNKQNTIHSDDETPKERNHAEPPLEEAAETAPADGATAASPETAAAIPAEQELEQLRQKWQRLAADYQNYQKRMQRQLEQASQMAQESVIRGLIPVLDNFSHTLEKGMGGGDVNTVLQGIQIVHDHLMNTLSALGMKRIEVQSGMPFNPQFHEAVMQEETAEYPAGTIVRELAGGYRMNDRALRPAKVSVAKAPAIIERPTAEDSSPECGGQK